jgi:hypothetical protein
VWTAGGDRHARRQHAILDIRDSLIADNVAEVGGGIYLHSDAGGSQLHVGNSTFQRNTGGIYVASPSTAEGTANFGDGNDENVAMNVATDIFAGTAYDYDGMKTFTCTASSCN